MAGHQEYKIAGHSVLFPCKPYPSQFSMMDKIIKGIERNQNCLLESPTGSGKSLALLCSALAWQAAEKRKQAEEIAMCDNKPEVCQCSCHSRKAETPSHCPGTPATTATATITATATATAGPLPLAASTPLTSTAVKGKSACDQEDDVVVVEDEDSDEEFRPLKKFREPGKSSVATRQKRVRPCIEYEDSTSPSVPKAAFTPVAMTTDPCSSTSVKAPPSDAHTSVGADAVPGAACRLCSCDSDQGKQKVTPRKVPKIYFGTRTHKQVAQIVRELRKTAYHAVPMTILASREHTCIHPQVSNAPNKNEGCENLMKDVGCRFKDRVVRYQCQPAIKALGLDSAWDLEDLVHLMKKKKACPYFLSRGLKEQSDLIICPYNYLVDPLIRDSMEINLRGQVVLLDEAHNIEDSVREAASQSLTHEQIQRAVADMDALIERGVKVADISKLRQMCQRLDDFITDNSESLHQRDFDQAYRLWSGFEIVAQLQRLGLGMEQCKELAATMASVKAAEVEERAGAGTPGEREEERLSQATYSVLEQVFLVMRYLYMEDMRHAEDYRASVVKSIQYVSANLNGSWLNSRKNARGRKTPMEVLTLNFWCMNPAVGFSDFLGCRSVILSSGTLSPMDSFQSELGTPFPVLLEAGHVIPDSQVWVGAVGQGPDGSSLQAVYRNTETFTFQDSLGKLILAVCQKVPKGVLCFLPSYKTLEKLTYRWRATGLWNRLEEHKHVLSEPRGSDKADFEMIIRQYYSIINTDDSGSDGRDGALFFAVCRGKVSEGMDFADNFARAVITVGIPYPNFKDIQVELKRKYNDRYQASRHLLSGSLWYEIQAFRALNQALGRCIRHRKDWGALIIVDDRFVKQTKKYANGLSKWVRQKLRVHQDCPSMLHSLEQFTQARVKADEQNTSLNSSLPMCTPPTPLPPTGPSPLASPPNPSPLASPSGPSPPLTSQCRSPLYDVSNTTKSTVATPTGPTPSATSSAQDAASFPLLTAVTTADGKVGKPDNASDTKIVAGSSLGRHVGLPAPTQHPSAPPVILSSTLGGRVPLVSPPTRSAPQGTSMATSSRQQRVTAPDKAAVAPTLRAFLDSRTRKPRPAGPQGVGLSPPVLRPPLCPVGTPPASAGNAGSAAPMGASVGVDTRMLYVPAQGPPSMLMLPHASPCPTLLHLPSPLDLSAGIKTLTVPPGIRHVVLGRTLDEANVLFAGSVLKTTGVPVTGPAPQPSMTTGSAPHPSQITGPAPQPSLTTGPAPQPSMTTSPTPQPSMTTVPAPQSKTQSLLGGKYLPAPTFSSPTVKAQDKSPSGQGLERSGCQERKTRDVPVVAASEPALPGKEVVRVTVSQARSQATPTSISGSSPPPSADHQGSHCESSPSLFGNSQASLSPSPSPKATPTRRSEIRGTIPSPTRMTTRSAKKSPRTAAVARGNAPKVAAATQSSATKSTGGKRVQADTAPTTTAATKSAGERGEAADMAATPCTACKDKTGKVGTTPTSVRSSPQRNTGGLMACRPRQLFRNAPKKSAVDGAERANSDLQSDAGQGDNCSSTRGEMGTVGDAGEARQGQGKLEGRGGGEIDGATCRTEEGEKETSRDAGEESSMHTERGAYLLDGQAGDAGADGEEEEEGKLERRTKGAKRRSLSLAGQGRKRKRPSSPADDASSQGDVLTVKCTKCGVTLFKDVKESDFERREHMPTCLLGVAEAGRPEVLYFRGTAATSQLPPLAIGNSRRRQDSGGLEANVQLIHCPGCHDDATLPAQRLLGAKVTLTDPSASTSTGQMWIFTHMVSMTSSGCTT